MWLTERLVPSEGVKLRSGQVEDASGFAVQSEHRVQAPEQLSPYGFQSRAEAGRQAVLLDGYCAGISSAPAGDLQAGEVRLYSAGGAEILLLNNGTVVINGQVFEPKES